MIGLYTWAPTVVFTGDRGLPAILINGTNILGWIYDNLDVINWCKTVLGYLFIFETVLGCMDQIPLLLHGEAHFFGFHGRVEVENE